MFLLSELSANDVWKSSGKLDVNRMEQPSVLLTAPYGAHSPSRGRPQSFWAGPSTAVGETSGAGLVGESDGLPTTAGCPADVVRKSLSEHGVEVFLLDGVNVRKDAPGFERALLRALAETGAGVILPIFYPEALADLRDRLASLFPTISISSATAVSPFCRAITFASGGQPVIIPLEAADKIRLLDNKLSASRLATSLDICQPRVYEDPTAEDIHFPVVFKRALGQGGDSVYFPRDRRALDRLLATAGECIVQEYIPGENVSVDALRWDGFFYAAAYRVLEPAGKGVSRLLDSIDYHGVCGVDFRVNDSGSYFLECNPRFSGGVASAVASGFDIPYLYYRLALGLPVSAADIHLTPGIRTGSLA